MTETVEEIRNQRTGEVVARVVHNPRQQPETFPVWIELSDGYSVHEGKQACHDRSDKPRKAKGVL